MQWLGGVFGDDSLTKSIVSCCARLKTSALFEDKVSALNELENLAKKHPLEVGARSISTICDSILSKYENELILIKKCIDILMILLLPPEEPYDPSLLSRHPQNNRIYYEVNLELLFHPNNVSQDRINIFIKLLKEEYSDEIELQYNIIQILTVILLYKNTKHKLRNELINIYGAMNTLSELLSSQHEFIRNSIIILLAHLCQNDKSLQKLIAFDGAFEKVLTITKDEDGVEGGIVVQDCLFLMENLLFNNVSNEKYFVEIGCIDELKLLLIPNDYSNQKQIKIVNKVINILMEITRDCSFIYNTQKTLGKIITHLLDILSFYGYDNDNDNSNNYSQLKQKCLILLRIILHLNIDNQNLFIKLRTPMTVYNNNTNKFNDIVINSILFLTKLTLNKLNNKYYSPILSLLSESVLNSLLYKNRNLQKILCDSLINASLNTNNKSQNNNNNNLYPNFGNLLLEILSIHSLSLSNNTNAKSKGGWFGDPLKYWMAIRIITHLISDNNDIKIYLLTKQLNIQNKLIYFIDIIMSSLITTINNNNTDQRIQLGLLLLIQSFCFESRRAIYHIFGNNNNYMQYILSLAISGSNKYNRGLSTYIIALCLEFARDLTPNMLNNINHNNNNKFSSFLFDIINNKIGLNKFKNNLDGLKQTDEYIKMAKIIQITHNNLMKNNNDNINNKNNNKNIEEMEKQKKLLISEIFLYDFDQKTNEYLPYKNNRMKINLFTNHFIKQFNSISNIIDKRIISLISSISSSSSNMNISQSNSPKNNKNNNNDNDGNNNVSNNNNNPGSVNNSSSLQLERLKTENVNLKNVINKLKKNNLQRKNMNKQNLNNNNKLNEKIEEIIDLKKLLNEQSNAIIKLKQKQQLNNNNKDIFNKYSSLRKTYDLLNRDHEDLLVYVGHIHEEWEKAQKKLLLLQNKSNNNKINNNKPNLNVNNNNNDKNDNDKHDVDIDTTPIIPQQLNTKTVTIE